MAGIMLSFRALYRLRPPRMSLSPWETSHRKKGFAVYGFRKVGIRLQLHLYRPPAREMQRLLRCGLLLRPSPEHGRNNDGRWRVFDMRSAHCFTPVQARKTRLAIPNVTSVPPHPWRRLRMSTTLAGQRRTRQARALLQIGALLSRRSVLVGAAVRESWLA